MDAVGEALSLLATGHSIVLLVIGTVVGTVVAIIPGMGGPMAMAVLIPVTFAMSPAEALILLVAIIGAGGFAGSMTAILVGVPGDETNAATTIDGSALARQGRAAEAIGASATASALGAIFGLTVLVAVIPLMRDLVLAIGPPEVFLMALLGLLLVGVISTRGSITKGVVSGLIGMAAGLIGFNYALGGIRYTFGIGELSEGIPIVPALIGMFAVPEVVMMMRTLRPLSASRVARGGVWRGVRAVLTRPRLLLQSSLLGTGIGAIPGIGGSLICWISYFFARRTSRHPEKFGHGSIDGVIGPEASIDSKDGGQLMPLLALGIPGGVSTAILAGAFLMHGIEPGTAMFTSNLSLVYLMVIALVLANITTSVVGLLTANAMVKITRVPSYTLGPLVIAVGATGSFVAVGSFYGVLVFLAFGVLGYLVVRGGYSRAAVVVGLILLPIVETNLHISYQSHRGELDFLLRPGTLLIMGIGAVAVVAPAVWRRVRRRVPSARDRTPVAVGAGTAGDDQVHGLSTERAAGDDARAGTGTSDIDDSPADHSAVDGEQETKDRESYTPVADLVVALFGVALAVLFLLETRGMSTEHRMVPVLVLPLLLVTAGFAVMRAVHSWNSRIDAGEYNRRDTFVLVAVAVLPPLMYVFGIFETLFVWSAAVMVWYGSRAGRRRIGMAGMVVLAGAVVLGLDLLVVNLLDVRIPAGAIW